MFVCLGFEVAAEHRFIFQDIMSGTKNLPRLDDKRVGQLVNVDHKPGGGVVGVPVAELAKWNFKLIFYYVKIRELRIRPMVLAEIDDNDPRIIEDH